MPYRKSFILNTQHYKLGAGKGDDGGNGNGGGRLGPEGKGTGSASGTDLSGEGGVADEEDEGRDWPERKIINKTKPIVSIIIVTPKRLLKNLCPELFMP